MTDMRPLQCAERGRQAISADQGNDDWVDDIDFSILDLNSVRYCVIAQVYGLDEVFCNAGAIEALNEYNLILDRLSESGDNLHDETEMGFVPVRAEQAEELCEAWVTILAPLREV